MQIEHEKYLEICLFFRKPKISPAFVSYHRAIGLKTLKGMRRCKSEAQQRSVACYWKITQIRGYKMMIVSQRYRQKLLRRTNGQMDTALNWVACARSTRMIEYQTGVFACNNSFFFLRLSKKGHMHVGVNKGSYWKGYFGILARTVEKRRSKCPENR